MALEIRQQLKMSQQLVMTPQLQQAIKLLQLSRLELVDLVRQELEENPILEETGDQALDEEEGLPESERSDDLAGEELPVPDTIPEVTGESEGLGDIDWQSYLEGYSLGGTTADNYEEDEDRPSYENLLTKGTSLAEHLLWQLGLSRIHPRDTLVATELIGNIDEDGYLKVPLEEIAEAVSSNVKDVERILELVQRFDPSGVGARSLQECLLIQVRQLDLQDSLIEIMLRDHIDSIEARRFNVIAKELEIALDEVHAAIRFISTLDPHPGRAYGQEDVHYVLPDIFVQRIGDEYVVTLNDEGLPNLRINSFYRSALSGGKTVDAKTGEYIQEKMRGAVWLIKSIHQRQRTIYKVTKSIVKFQKDFFDRGIDYLMPLVLRDVAEDIEMHESTISRVTTNKYVQTPQGLYELKYFFNSSINTTGGDFIASESVKSRIKEIVAEENPKKPFSDQKIVELLEKKGISIARRTVTKYREMIGIRSSSERKCLF
jgi:RNA polymerase sigma-54 factor